uniref:Putative DegT/DnrJ/EryC1/StrS aminotransferase family protein n=1 Tax=viral metagenome TaxID=1070528 RepID=A0A6M3LCL2_9ZZZZ
MIKLIDTEMWREDLKLINEFIHTNPKQLSQGEVVKEFENTFARTFGIKYAVYVNSGSSANLLMAYAAIEEGLVKTRTAIVPALSWSTTVSPWMQFGFKVVLCDSNQKNLGMDCTHLQRLCEENPGAVVMPVHVLGMPADIVEIRDIANRNECLLLEDCCEAMGSMAAGKYLGSFGAMATYSCFTGHQLSTIEGGVVVTDNDKLYIMLKLLRSHGWNRDVPGVPEYEAVDTFQDRFNFYVPGYNLRGQEINAWLGINRLARFRQESEYRERLFMAYNERMQNKYWKPVASGFVSAMAYPVIHRDREKIVADLVMNDIETRPLIAGSMEYQPMFVKRYGFKVNCQFAEQVHKYGFYVPIHCAMGVDDSDSISDIINKYYIEDVVNEHPKNAD